MRRRCITQVSAQVSAVAFPVPLTSEPAPRPRLAEVGEEGAPHAMRSTPSAPVRCAGESVHAGNHPDCEKDALTNGPGLGCESLTAAALTVRTAAATPRPWNLNNTAKRKRAIAEGSP